MSSAIARARPRGVRDLRRPILPPGSPFEFFFLRFGQPDGQVPNSPRRRNFTMGQGSGFFISADGYAVTNNHVVDKADTVEVTTDDGNYAVYAVTQVRNADPSKEAANERTARQRRAELQHGQGEFAAYVDEAERTTKIVKNEKLFE